MILYSVSDRLLPYFSNRDELTIQDGVIFRGERLVVPSSLRKSMKDKVHASHISINSSLRRVRYLIYMPQMYTDIRHYVEICGVCATYADRQHAESIATTSETVVGKLKNNFSRHGIPHTLVSDNGPQYSLAVLRKFAHNWQFVHESISPGYSQADGAAQAAVKVPNRLLRKCKVAGEDPYLGLLNIRNNQLKPGVPADVGKQSGGQRTNFRSVLNSDHSRRD